tara:strand:+ start:9860 stop:11218 length:1359 start_codon:yes stop_codon:yes gene_type:complete
MQFHSVRTLGLRATVGGYSPVATSEQAPPFHAPTHGGGTESVVVQVERDEEDNVDFTNASLYLSGMQTVFAICMCAVVSVLSCWLAPEGGVSAVRTLAFCVATSVVLMRRPLRVGRVRGVQIVFASLQPSVAIYLLGLVVEQLVHTCASDTTHAPSWRRVVFHGMILMMLVSGLMRARRPMEDTDLPFLLTALALLVTAMMPPPAVALVGPLCQPVDVFDAADRVLRALSFSVVYCSHVYASTAADAIGGHETVITVTRAASAAVWTMGAYLALLPMAVVQCALIIYSRLALEAGQPPPAARRAAARTAAAPPPPPPSEPDRLVPADGVDDAYAASPPPTEADPDRLLRVDGADGVDDAYDAYAVPHMQPPPPPLQGFAQPTIGPLAFRQVGGGEPVEHAQPPPPPLGGPRPTALTFGSLVPRSAAAANGTAMSDQRFQAAVAAAQLDGTPV